VAMVAQEQGLARLTMSYDELYNHAHEIIKRSRDLTQMMMEQNFIPPAPER
jgi:malate dehydrogenase (oxaloacetate-decarboxylating)